MYMWNKNIIDKYLYYTKGDFIIYLLDLQLEVQILIWLWRLIKNQQLFSWYDEAMIKNADIFLT